MSTVKRLPRQALRVVGLIAAFITISIPFFRTTLSSIALDKHSTAVSDYKGFYQRYILKEKGLPPNEEEIIRNRCIQFIVHLINELKSRLPENLKLMKSIKRISVEHALSHNKEPITDLMLYFNKKQEDVAKVDEQWRQIHLLKWENTKNTKTFWYEVMDFKDMAGENRFQELAVFAISLLVLPQSNADVERLFSMMNVIITKNRNRMKLQLLSSILTVRAGLAREGKCCNSNVLPNNVVHKVGTKEMYSAQTADNQELDEDDSSEDEYL